VAIIDGLDIILVEILSYN